MSAHKLYIAEVRHPIEVGATEAHLMPWLSRRSGTNLRVPDFSHFDLKLLGGRLLPGPSGPAALLMFENGSGDRVTFYCSKAGPQQMAFRYLQSDNVAAIRWVESGYTFVVSGNADKARLKELARDRLRATRESRAATAGEVAPRPSRRPQGNLTPLGKTLARIVGRVVAQLSHQFFEFGIGGFRQDDAHGCEQIALALLVRQAFAASGGRYVRRWCWRDRKFDGAVERRHANLAAEHRLVERDRQFEADVGAVPLEIRVLRRYAP